MIPELGHRGFGYGSGMIDPTKQHFLLNIPKNASSFIADWSYQHHWRAALISNHPTIREITIVLRDPVERWISGIAQYIKTYILSVHGPNGPVFPGETTTKHDYAMTAVNFVHHYNDAVERLLFDVIDLFDDHVWCQYRLIPETGDDIKRNFFIMTPGFDQTIAAHLGFQILPGLDRNRGDENPDTAEIQRFIRERLTVRPELIDRVKKRYQQDFALIERVIYA